MTATPHPTPQANTHPSPHTGAEPRLVLSLMVGGRLCGLPVPRVRDVLREQAIATVPLAPPGVAGVLNLRGRIVTAVCLRSRLGLPSPEPATPRMSVVVEQDGELYSLLADTVREVLPLPPDAQDEAPATLRGPWRDHSVAVHRLADSLLIELDPDKLLAFGARRDSVRT